MNRPHLVITPGDPDGIGPEVTVKALKKLRSLTGHADVTLVGSAEALAAQGLSPSSKLNLLAPHHTRRKSPGWVSGWAIETATRMVLSNRDAALVTGPISKERLRKAGFPYQGHTDFLAALCGTREATMMLANAKLRVSLVTVHVPISRVSRLITRQAVSRTILHTLEGLESGFGIVRPRIAVLGLNPHAGENGLLGNEENTVIAPTLRAMRRRLGPKVRLEGPFPSDTFFSKDLSAFDAVVAMYHDQGLIPVKSLDFANTINISLGLPIIRTSVDHGVAFDIAGKGIADPTSMVRAIETAFAWSKLRAKKRG